MNCPAMFSPEDMDLTTWSWSLSTNGYARVTRGTRRGHRSRKQWTVFAHRVVLARIVGRELASDEYCDHLNRNRLDNRRENLRLVTWQQNSQNLGGKPGSTSGGVRGVRRQWLRSGAPGRWQALVIHNGRSHCCGTYDTIEEAAEAAAAKRRELGFHNEPRPPAALLPERAASFLRDERGLETVEYAVLAGLVVVAVAVVIALAKWIGKQLRELRGELDPGRSGS